MTLNLENLAAIAAAYVAAIGLISWQSPARLFDSLALATLAHALVAWLAMSEPSEPAAPPEPTRSGDYF